jgi:hypothetical protein
MSNNSQETVQLSQENAEVLLQTQRTLENMSEGISIALRWLEPVATEVRRQLREGGQH